MRTQRIPVWACRLGMRLLARRNDALASLFGLGVLQDRPAGSWDDTALTERGIRPTTATEFIETQALALG